MNDEDAENLKWLQIFKSVFCFNNNFPNFIFKICEVLLVNYTPYLLIYFMFACIYSKYDLYSKSKVRVDVEKVKPYYQSLINKVRILLQQKFVKLTKVFRNAYF